MDNFTSDRLPDSYAICLLGHGSREPEGIEEFLILWEKLRKKKFCRITECGFLEFAKPDISEALSACRQDGIQNIIIVPGILLPGEHTHRDIPEAIRNTSQNHPEINIFYAEPLGTKNEVMQVCRERIEEAEKSSPKSIPRPETLLMAVAHGSNNENSNSQAEKNLLLLGQNSGFCKTVTHFAGTSQHSPEDTLEKLLPQELHRVILLPYFLFTGVWVKRVHALAETFSRKYPNIEFLNASCLKHHELIVDTLIQQARESIS
jgi:precorrin-8X/cobalt-precorrin-8 methylmutase